jgi:hypothetical protein
MVTCKDHLGAWNVGLRVEQVLEQVLLGPGAKNQMHSKNQAASLIPYHVIPEFLLAAE